MSNFIHKYKMPLIIFWAAFLIRLIYIIQSRSNPTFYLPMIDELWNLNWAKEIISGDFWGDEAYFRGPLYPYLLACFMKISGGSLLAVRIFHAIISASSSVLVFLIGDKLLGRKIGIISGFVYALYGTLMLYEAMLLIPVLFIFLNLLGIYLMTLYKGHYDLKKWLIAGIVIGLSAIARPNILLLTPLFLIWIYIGFKEIKDLKKRLIIPAIYFLGILIPVLTVTVRNFAVTGEPILISSQGGVNLYIGNNSETEGLTMLMPELDLNEAIPWSQFTDATREAAEQEVGHSLTAAEESSFWTGKAVDFILSNPIKFIETTFKKLVYFFVGFENSDQTDIYQAREYSSLYSILLWKNILYFPFGLLLPFAVVGVIGLWKRKKQKNEMALLYLFILGYIPTVILFLVTARHRLPVIPFIIIFATFGAVLIVETISKKNWNKFIKYVIPFFVILIFCNQTYFDIGFENEFQTHYNLALTYKRQGNLPLAEKEYREALKHNPGSVTALNNLGYTLYEQGKADEALSYYARVIELEPTYAESYNNAGLIYESRGDLTKALQFYQRTVALEPSMYQAHLNIGDVYMAQSDFGNSEQAYKKSRDIVPDNKAPYFKLGALYARQQRFAEAEQMFLKGSERGEPSAIDFVNWGNVNFSSNQPAQAISLYQRSLAKDSTIVQCYMNLALLFKRFNYPPDSTRKYLNKLLQLNPNYTPARDLLNEIGG